MYEEIEECGRSETVMSESQQAERSGLSLPLARMRERRTWRRSAGCSRRGRTRTGWPGGGATRAATARPPSPAPRSTPGTAAAAARRARAPPPRAPPARRGPRSAARTPDSAPRSPPRAAAAPPATGPPPRPDDTVWSPNRHTKAIL